MYKNTAGFFVIPLLDQFWEEKNYCERRNELSQRRPVALPNRHKHLCLFKLGYEVHALLSSIMYILSGKKITAVYPMSQRRWDQNTRQVDNRLDRARATYRRLLHISSMLTTVLSVEQLQKRGGGGIRGLDPSHATTKKPAILPFLLSNDVSYTVLYASDSWIAL